MFLLTSFRKATQTIYIQSPNITSSPVLSALYEALRNGIDVHIVTSTRMMVLEQFLTAGTTTEMCITSFGQSYGKLLREYEKNLQSHAEIGRPRPGKLTVDFYAPKEGSDVDPEPLKSHLKLTIVDGELVVLGSGNMDRASWYTSQELGIAFFSKKLAQTIKADMETSLQGRLVPRISPTT